MAKQQPPRPTGKKYIARAQREAESQRRIIYGLGTVGALILLVLAIGLIRTFVLLPRQPVALVNDVELSTADYRKRFLYEQYFIDTQIGQLQEQLAQFEGAFPNNPEFQQQLETQTSQQIQQLLFQRRELETLTYESMVEEELIRQESERRGIVVSEDEITSAINARAAADAGGYIQADANATATTNAERAADATATAELFTPTPTITPTVEITDTEVITGTDALTGSEAITATAVPAPTFEPQPTPTINVIAGDNLTQAVADWEANFADVANMNPEDLRRQVEADLLRDKLREAIAAEIETTALQANARHILVATEEEAQAAVERLTEGEDFADLAMELSTDTGSGANGGDLGWFSREAMVESFAEASFSQEVGTVGDPVESQFGWHIIEVLEREERELEGAALTRAERTAYDDWLMDVRSGAIEDLRTEDSAPSQLSGLSSGGN